jgi:poly(3-hydroxybutyrate) depolymerase
MYQYLFLDIKRYRHALLKRNMVPVLTSRQKSTGTHSLKETFYQCSLLDRQVPVLTPSDMVPVLITLHGSTGSHSLTE